MEIISARQAFNEGLTRYFTGKICKYGHYAERMISNGSCVNCLKEKRKRTRQDIYEATKVWRLKNPGARKIEAEKYRKKYPEKVAATSKAYRLRNIEQIRKRQREDAKRMRSINPEREKERLKRFSLKKEQKRIQEAGREKPNLCEICKGNEFKIVFDHCHTNGHFRGWICDRCNRVLGIVKDSTKLLNNLALYLEKTMTKLNAKTRNALTKSKFALPQSRKYPVDTKARAANAKARATQMVKAGKLSPASKAKIDAKANKVLGKNK